MSPKICKYIIIVILLFIICYLGVTILNNKKQHFTNINCNEAFKRAETYKKQLNSFKTFNVNKKLNNRLEFLLEIYSISFKCRGQQVAIDNITDIKIEVLEKAIKELSVECHKTILDCYKNKLVNDIKLLISSKLKKYIYNTEAFTFEDNSILPINYFIQTLKDDIDKEKYIPLSDLDSTPLIKKQGDNHINILLNISQEISTLDKIQLDLHTNSFLKVYSYIYTIYVKNSNLQKDVNMSTINVNRTTNKPLSNEELTQQYIDNKEKSESKDPINIFNSTYLQELEDKLLDVYLQDLYKVMELIGSSDNKLNLVEINSIKTFLNNFHENLTAQENSSTKVNSILGISNDLLDTIKSNNKKYNQ